MWVNDITNERVMMIKDIMLACALILVLIGMTGCDANIKYVSTSSGACVKVQNESGFHDCSVLKAGDKYTVIYVK